MPSRESADAPRCRRGVVRLLAAVLWLPMAATGASSLIEATSDDGIRLVGEYLGPARGSGTATGVVFIHGWSQARLVWSEQIPVFAASRPVLAYDLRGHGDSDKPRLAAAYGERFQHARDLEALLEAVGLQRAVLVGWSFGAIVASDAALHLGAARVCGLVLVAGPAEANTARVREHFGPLMQEIGPMREGPRGAAERDAVRRFLVASRTHGSWSPDRFGAIFAANLRLTPTLRRLVVTRPTYENHAALNALGIPILLIHGAADPVLGIGLSRATRSRLAHAELSVYPDTGHWPFIERAARFNEELRRFVEGTPCAAAGER